MEVELIDQRDDTHLHWCVKVGPSVREFDATITEQHPEERVAWKSDSGPEHAGVVTFRRIDDNTTRVTMQIDVDPDGFLENVAEGWDAVTTRRLSTGIEYSQPVLYKHFTGMEQIADAIAIDGFAELADMLRVARADTAQASDALTRIAHAYLDFARDNPAVYDAMFTRATNLPFAADDTPPQLRAAFRRAVPGSRLGRRRSGCRRAHRGVLCRTARTGRAHPCRPTTHWLRLGTSPLLVEQHQQTRNTALALDHQQLSPDPRARCGGRLHDRARAA